MPNISNVTVASGTGLSTAGNGGRKIVSLSNGWLVAAVFGPYSGLGNDLIVFYVSKDLGATWQGLTWTGAGANSSFSIVSKQTRVYCLFTEAATSVFQIDFDATTVPFSNRYGTRKFVSSGLTMVSNVTLAISELGTELHAAWQSGSKSVIQYTKSNIETTENTWSPPVLAASWPGSTQHVTYPSIVLDSKGAPGIACRFNNTDFAGSIIFYFYQNASGTWVSFQFSSDSYLKERPTALFVPKSINGLEFGRIWMAWHARDSIDSGRYNIFTAYSDNNGVSWSSPEKQTTGSVYSQTNAVLTADRKGRVFLTWDLQNGTVIQTAQKVYDGSWGATTTFTGDGYTNVSTLFDNQFSFQMASPPLVRQSSSGVFFSGNFNTGASVSPVSGSLGSKETSTLTTYTVTPENGSTVTQIVEKLNGVTLNTYSNPASLSRTFTIPQVNWEGIPFWHTNTAEIIVTDSNGVVTTTTYTFVKALADDAPLLEGVAATEDAYERISDKRDALAAQVGLSAGATFDAISAQLASGQAIVKRSTGTATTSASALSGKFYVIIPFASIGFVPKSVDVVLSSNGTPYCSVNLDTFISPSTSLTIMQRGTSNESLDGTTWYINSTGVRLPIDSSLANTAMKWIAYG